MFYVVHIILTVFETIVFKATLLGDCLSMMNNIWPHILIYKKVMSESQATLLQFFGYR